MKVTRKISFTFSLLMPNASEAVVQDKLNGLVDDLLMCAHGLQYRDVRVNDMVFNLTLESEMHVEKENTNGK
jgi:hypothetical protein